MCIRDRLVTEDEARRTFKGESYHTEFCGILAYDYCVAKPVGKASSWPEAQVGTFDYVVDDVRKQFKTPYKRTDQYGYQIDLRKNAGKVNGKPTHQPYHADDFDELVIVLVGDVWVDVWTISRNELLDRGYLATETDKGKQSFYVHLPEELSGEQPKEELGDGKRGPICESLWTRQFHMRYAIGADLAAELAKVPACVA